MFFFQTMRSSNRCAKDRIIFRSEQVSPVVLTPILFLWPPLEKRRATIFSRQVRFAGNLDPSILKAGFAGMELDVTWIPFEDPQGFVLWMILRSFSVEVFKMSICHRSSKLWPRIL